MLFYPLFYMTITKKLAKIKGKTADFVPPGFSSYFQAFGILEICHSFLDLSLNFIQFFIIVRPLTSVFFLGCVQPKEGEVEHFSLNTDVFSQIIE
jgi:hypothetical protein